VTGPVVVTSAIAIALLVVISALVLLVRIRAGVDSVDDQLCARDPEIDDALGRWRGVAAQAGEVRRRLDARDGVATDTGAGDDGP